MNWRSNNKGTDKSFEKWIELPQERDSYTILTRKDRQKRQLLDPRVPDPARKMKTIKYIPRDMSRYPDHWCVYVNCDNNSFTLETYFMRVPPVVTINSKNIQNKTRFGDGFQIALANVCVV